MSAPEAVPARRRRGQELEAALLQAAWDDLVQVGYARLTMASIAARAGTSEPVLYRRWANKDHLVLNAMQHHRAAHPVEAPDTGSLRGDLIAELTAAAAELADFYRLVVATAGSGLLADSGLTPAEIRERVMGASPATLRPAFERAVHRGELDPDRVPAAVLTMPYQLLRHDLLIATEPPNADRIRSIVDDLFLPLVTPNRS